MVARVVNALDRRCPGALHAVAVRDGLLARIRIPGGLVTAAQVRALASAAERCGDGRIDVTSRGSVQLRGIAAAALTELAEALAAAGLLPSATHDRVRNIVASPFTGVDPDEMIDTRPLVRELDARLVADRAFAALPAKFCFAVDGGGRPFDTAIADLALRAVKADAGLRFHLVVGGMPTGFGVATAAAVGVLLDAARAALAFAASREAPPRGWRLVTLRGARSAIVSAIAPRLAVCPVPATTAQRADVPTGILPARRANCMNVVPSIPLGRLEAKQARAVADIADRCRAELRLAPWRGVVIAGVPRAAVRNVVAGLDRVGLAIDASDGYAGLAACAGIDGCAFALADVRRHAAELARLRSGMHPSAMSSVNLAACAKRCGMRRGATADLVATETGYDVTLEGKLVRSGASPADALSLAIVAHGTRAVPETVS